MNKTGIVTCKRGHSYECKSIRFINDCYFWSSEIDFCKVCGTPISYDDKCPKCYNQMVSFEWTDFEWLCKSCNILVNKTGNYVADFYEPGFKKMVTGGENEM